MRKITLLLGTLLLSCSERTERLSSLNVMDDVLYYDVLPDTGWDETLYVEETTDGIFIKGGLYRIDFDRKRGYFSIKTDRSVIQNAVAEVIDKEGQIYATNDQQYIRSLESEMNNGMEYNVSILNSSTKQDVDIRLVFSLTNKGRSIKIYEEVINKREDVLKIKKMRPVVLRSKKGGALFIGRDPSEHRILENGSNGFLDFYVRILPGDVKNDGMGDIFPFEMEGNSVSNWNNCVADLKSKRVAMSGFITYERSIPMVNLSFDNEYVKKDPEGRTGFTYFSMDCPYIPVSLNAQKDIPVRSEIVYMDLVSESCQDALELFAKGLKKFHKIVLWNERIDPENNRNYRIPNGWNSWSGGGGSGGYGTDINEDIILKNLDIMKNEFREFGMEWFQIDDGWMVDYGDWYLNKDRFPDHLKSENLIDSFQYINDIVGNYYMKPGLWIAGFTAYKSSDLYKTHTEWFAPKLPYTSNEYQILDFSRPETVDFVYNTFKRIRDWGFKWVKLDFSYWVMAAASLKNPDITPVEGYRRGLMAIRSALDDDVHLLNVSATGPSIGIADSVRITLDNMPVWDGVSKNLYDMANQGIKPTIRTATRRYYYNKNVWINHPDLIFFRSMPNNDYPELSLDEARAFVSYVGITGGIVKIGEKIVEMRPEWIDSVRRILPVFPIKIRPLDLMMREFPEIWAGEVKDTKIPEYNILGLFNWGKNRDLSVNPYVELEDSERMYEIDFENIGLDPEKEYLVYEFWDEKFYGIYKRKFSVSIPSHRAMVFAIREKVDSVTLLGTNRHILMGAEEISDYNYDEKMRILSLGVHLPQSLNSLTCFEHRLYFYIPEGLNLSEVKLSGSGINMGYSVNGGVLAIKLNPEKTTDAEIKLYF